MNKRISQIMQEIRRLEEELTAEMLAQQSELSYWFEGEKVKFEESIAHAHRLVRVGLIEWFSSSNPRNVLSAPFVYAMVVPFAVLDGSVSAYQAICFRLYDIPTVRRSSYIVIDRFQLRYLNQIERLNCVFCSYANGVIAYAREIAARSEQYWCPIKHARKILDPHSRYLRFSDFGDSDSFHEGVREARDDLRNESNE